MLNLRAHITSFAVAFISLLPSFTAHGDEEKYFGYWGSASYKLENVSDQLKGVVNTLWVGAANLRDVQTWIKKIQIAESNGQNVVLDLHGAIAVSKIDSRLKADATQLWGEFYDQVVLRYRDRIVGINITDEPYFNNKRLPSSSQLSDTQVTANTERAIALIKKSDPTLKTLLTFGGLEVDFGYALPKGIDWVGYNCYAGLAAICPVKKLVPRLESLRRRLKPEQRLIFTMDAWSNQPVSQGVQNASLQYDKIYADYIARHFDQVAGVFPFIYQNFSKPGEINNGASDMPRVQFWLNTFGQHFMERGGPIQMPPGIFRQKKGRRSHVYAVGSQGYCSFENRGNFSALVRRANHATIKSLKGLWSGIELKNPYLGKCTADLSALVTSLKATRVSTQSAQLSWEASPNAGEFAVVMAEKGKPLPNCASGSAKATRENTITWNGLSKSKNYVFSVCARDREMQILSHPAPHVEAVPAP